MRIAVLDTDRHRADQICACLKAAGHICESISGESALEHAGRGEIDLLILDCPPGDTSRNGLLQKLRDALPPKTPVLLLAERTDDHGIATALEAGASDFLIKPMRQGELVTRVKVLLKRAYRDQAAGEQIHFGPYIFETASVRVIKGNHAIEVTQKEFELALLLFRHLGRPLSRAYIQEAIWSKEPNIASRTMDTHVSRVRTKLGLRPENGYRLVPVYSYGYQLEQLAE